MTCPRQRTLATAFTVFAGTMLFALASGVLAAGVRTEHVEAELVAAKTAVVPGEPLTVALRLKIEDGWHTYWRNPGDSGLPTTLAWTLPAGVAAGPIEWPAPRALPAGPLVNFGYEGDALHLVEVQPSDALAVGDTLSLKARADWLVCRELCIPEGADLTLELPVARNAGVDPRWGAAIAAARAALPQPLRGWQASAEAKGATIALKLVPASAAANPGEIRFFPYASDQIEPSGAQRLARDGDAFVLTLPVASTLSGRPDRIAGVLTATGGLRRRARRDDRRCPCGHRDRGTETRARRRTGAQSFAGAAAGERRHARAGDRDRLRARRRPAAQSDALRLPGAFAQGAGVRDAP